MWVVPSSSSLQSYSAQKAGYGLIAPPSRCADTSYPPPYRRTLTYNPYLVRSTLLHRTVYAKYFATGGPDLAGADKSPSAITFGEFFHHLKSLRASLRCSQLFEYHQHLTRAEEINHGHVGSSPSVPILLLIAQPSTWRLCLVWLALCASLPRLPSHSPPSSDAVLGLLS